MNWLNYFINMNKEKSNNDKLVMTILCRNEVDIIEDNIRIHAKLGVDSFVVMDNGSTDGTREKLVELSQQFDLDIIDQPEQTYQQSKWMTELAFYAKDKKKANWVISNDADEFWIPTNKATNLKDFLSHRDSVVSVTKKNLVLTEQAFKKDYCFYDAEYRVQFPINYPVSARIKDENVAILLNETPGKVIVNPNGFIKISGGNHRAKHIANAVSSRVEDSIMVYHYPIRSWEHFQARVTHRKELLINNPKVGLGNHEKRWIKLMDEGLLYDEYKKFIFSSEQIDFLQEIGVIIKDLTPNHLIKTIKNS